MKLDKAALEKARDEALVYRNDALRALEWAKPEYAASIQREVDRLTGYHAALESVFDQHFRFPVAPGTVMHGIDVSRLSWETRAMVVGRDLGTILALGGKLDPE